jgi:hypothetical protein
MHILLGRPQHGGGEHIHQNALRGRAAEPSPLLRHLAGDFAGEIARVWPAPHAPFLLAEAARRHLVCLALALAEEAAVRPGPAFVACLLDGSLKRAVAALGPQAPNGLVRALGRLGEAAWAAEDYRLLLALLADPGVAKVLRHARAITAGEVRSLGALPPDLAAAGGILLRLTDDQARLVTLCYAGLSRREGPERARAVGQRWAASRTPRGLFARINEDLSVEACQPFHPGTERLRPLATRKALVEAARRYRNCLEGRELGPRVQYYEWAGPPGVIVQVDVDPLWGWVLSEGRLESNAVVPVEVREAIAAELRGMGVHVGPGRWNLNWTLKGAAEKDFTFDDDARQVELAFGD